MTADNRARNMIMLHYKNVLFLQILKKERNILLRKNVQYQIRKFGIWSTFVIFLNTCIAIVI